MCLVVITVLSTSTAVSLLVAAFLGFGSPSFFGSPLLLLSSAFHDQRQQEVVVVGGDIPFLGSICRIRRLVVVVVGVLLAASSHFCLCLLFIGGVSLPLSSLASRCRRWCIAVVVVV